MSITQLTIASRVKPGGDVLFQELHGDAVLLDLKTSVYFGLDNTGTRMWQLMAEHESLARVVDVMSTEYDVSTARLTEDLLSLVRQLQEQGLVDVE